MVRRDNYHCLLLLIIPSPISQSDIESKKLLEKVSHVAHNTQGILHEIRNSVEEIRGTANISKADISNINTRLDRMEIHSYHLVHKTPCEAQEQWNQVQAFLNNIAAIELHGVIRAMVKALETMQSFHHGKDPEEVGTLTCIQYGE